MALCSHLAKRATVRALFSACFYSSPPRYQSLPLLTPPLLFASLSTQTQPTNEKELPFIAQYLISTFNFSSDRALKHSVHGRLAAIKSPERPEAVVKFLTDTGLTDAQIKDVVSFRPHLLAYNVDETLKPKVDELINGGCSRELLVHLFQHIPRALSLNDAISRIQFWRDFVGNDDQALCRMIKRNGYLMAYSIDKRILPRIDLLKEYGMSNPDILLLLHRRGTRCMSQSVEFLKRTLEMIEELGISRGSAKFPLALKALSGRSTDTIKRKMEFFKETYGWSQEDVNSAFRKFPTILTLSEDNLKSKIDFLIEKTGVQPTSIASEPKIFGYSLEGVLMARYNVLSALEAKGLKKQCSIFTACYMSEKEFSETYVLPFEKDIPEVCHAYMAARGVKGQD